MATADQIKALVESRLQDDDERFFSIALQIAAHAARRGQGRMAEEIRDLVDKARKRRAEKPRSRPVPIQLPKGPLEELLSVSFPDARLAEMVLDDAIRAQLRRIVREYVARAHLSKHGLQARRKLLLVGPPGSGKTLTATALAGELSVPLLVIRFDGLITKFMGETSAKLRLIFESMVSTRGVYLFDEFDAIGGQRGQPNEVGEIRRVLNTFLQLIEADESDSIVIAATNHVEHLDRALFRRFDDVVRYGLPSDVQLSELIQNLLGPFDTSSLDVGRCVHEAAGLSYADVARACGDAAKVAVLDGGGRVTTAALEQALTERKAAMSGTP